MDKEIYRLKLILKSAHGKKSNAILLAGIYLCLKNIVSYISQSPPLGKFIQCKYTSWVLPLNHCYVGMPKIGAFCVEPRSSQDVSTDVTKGLHPSPSPIHNSKQLGLNFYFKKSLHDSYSCYRDYHILLLNFTFLETHTTLTLGKSYRGC